MKFYIRLRSSESQTDELKEVEGKLFKTSQFNGDLAIYKNNGYFVLTDLNTGMMVLTNKKLKDLKARWYEVIESKYYSLRNNKNCHYDNFVKTFENLKRSKLWKRN